VGDHDVKTMSLTGKEFLFTLWSVVYQSNAIFGWQTRIHLLHKVFFAIMASHKFITFIFRFTVGKSWSA